MKSREISPENLLLSLAVGTKHSQCPAALGSCFIFFVDFSRDQWRFMTSLTGGEMRDSCVIEFFYPRSYKCGVILYLAKPSFATPLLIYAATEASNLKFVIQLVLEE